ncbi:putative histidine kinase, classic (plasmid) [Deinococcus deserti VCD115]|uniref:histidine kinase n=2 Tax=Deinococcus TaxID=1298 RepID=C1D2T2_DEIDV|nr:putative histidine kinase, classic [Deinococcus deserti VCD115]
MRRLAEEASEREHELRFRHMVEASPIGVAVGTMDGTLLMVNDAYLRLLGYSRSEFEAGLVDWQALTPEAEWEKDRQMFEVAFAEGLTPGYEKTMLTRTGEVRQVLVTLIASHEGAKPQVIAYVQDITDHHTERRRDQARAAELEQQVSSQSRELENHLYALRTFVDFTTQVGVTGDIPTLLCAAELVLAKMLGHGDLLYARVEGQLAHVTAYSSGVPERTRERFAGGFRVSQDVLERTREGEEMVFYDHWQPLRDKEGLLSEYHALAVYPYLRGGQMEALLVLASPHDAWTPDEHAILLALGRSMGLAAERVMHEQRLQEHSDAARARTRALESFAQLARDLAFETDQYVLVRRAQAIVAELIGEGFAQYFEVEDDRWYIRAQTGNTDSPATGNPELDTLLVGGLPFGQITNLNRPWVTGQPYYQDRYDPAGDGWVPGTEVLASTATIPVMVYGRPYGIFAYGTFRPRQWSRTDRAVLEAAGHQLGLAIERAEQARVLETQRQALMDANEELEAFSYSVSHDLRTPVRHARSFSELAVRALQAGNVDKTGQYLDMIVQATDRMTVLIDAMLDLSRTSRQDLLIEDVNLDELLRLAVDELRGEPAAQAVEWQLDPLGHVPGDWQLLSQVLGNLLNNAVKYSRTQPSPRVHVWAEHHPTSVTIHVQDNGVGFDERFISKLFGVFQRLHHHDEFEGTGVGLANVRRIVTRHGGTVAAKSRIGEGAVFSVCLPKALQEFGPLPELPES